jgi:hypothetical protein
MNQDKSNKYPDFNQTAMQPAALPQSNQYTSGQGVYSQTHENEPISLNIPTQEEVLGKSERKKIPQAPRSHYETIHTETIIRQPQVVREVVVVERPLYFYDYEDPFPSLSMVTAWIILLINIFLPGVGTIIVGCLGVSTPWYFILMGIFQLITAPFIIGWIMAIWTSVVLIMYSK